MRVPPVSIESLSCGVTHVSSLATHSRRARPTLIVRLLPDAVVSDASDCSLAHPQGWAIFFAEIDPTEDPGEANRSPILGLAKACASSGSHARSRSRVWFRRIVRVPDPHMQILAIRLLLRQTFFELPSMTSRPVPERRRFMLTCLSRSCTGKVFMAPVTPYYRGLPAGTNYRARSKPMVFPAWRPSGKPRSHPAPREYRS